MMSKESDRYQETCRRLSRTLLSSVEYFRHGDDSAGLDDFICAVTDLEDLLTLYQCAGEPVVRLDSLLTALSAVHACILNQDITGLTDVLEFSVYPHIDEWTGRFDGRNADGKGK